jgi:hypothetical protein
MCQLISAMKNGVKSMSSKIFPKNDKACIITVGERLSPPLIRLFAHIPQFDG